ncbi:HNH endonuclease signature motif containing protein [Arthrobacter sp. 8AJ]|uniref:HNH endonuclease signature motif containing protein n=1 Tax=Arthrobacter sp. 8AJ TaxID=2653130 RepID=UPI0012F10651|nr:HNH endonuclease signature motif containing protein [Arthrobacter sp. 8AJ]VXC17596.1 hypothetical protein ARTHRO8AJ_430105 [Arthrobacter sp. 8AJ]
MGISGGLGAVLEGVRASVAALDALEKEDDFLASGAHGGAGVDIGAGTDVLQRRYGIRLERLELMARLEAQLAAVKAETAAEAVEFQQTMTPPDASIQDRTYADMSVVEEIAGVLTISSAAAGALVEQSRRICSLPPVMNALAAGAMSWQHARIVADETEGLTPEGALKLVAHFFDPDAPNPARGAAPGELVPSRFRAKVRGWRERHHPDSIEKRHAKGAADRRMEYVPGLTEAIKRWIRMRDTKCTFPGCTNRTPDNETDHLQAWQHGGTTGTSNLAQLCPKHHRLKHHSQWTPDPANKNEPPGWTSPTGRHYNPEHPDPEPTHWPQRLLALFGDASERETSAGALEWPDGYVPEHLGLLEELSVPDDPGPSETELPADPFPEWSLFLDFEDLEAQVLSG